jgi:major membrane immunogen (membrane-anchored lipoprotein)
MKNKKMYWLVFALLSLSLLLTACGSSRKSEFPTGKFLDPESKIGAGYQFNEDGTWTAFNSAYTTGRGTYSVDGDLFIEETNNQNCGTSPMSFKYSFDGTTLKFELTDQSKNDDCDGRKQAFDGRVYLLSK